jgi:hypothetical protein
MKEWMASDLAALFAVIQVDAKELGSLRRWLTYTGIVERDDHSLSAA